ncbi:hypothetical protein [Solirubrobacter pauli]|uniref:hypothetical protein n=1 Tax=Solirubrobacter pauli TaxID=166793 RepID=UPI001476DFAD|nr:hypothetical protein [Solirubrobacter pauli]
MDVEDVVTAAVAVYHRTGLPYETVESAAVLALELPDEAAADLGRRIANIARSLDAAA